MSAPGRPAAWRRYVALLLLVAACWPLGQAAYIALKAELAQHLLARAWDQSNGGRDVIRPWRGADLHPVARLSIGVDDAPLLVLGGASMRNLAFGPAHVGQTPWPGDAGTTVLVGHRDTHFSVLAELAPGDRLRFERGGKVYEFEVSDAAVAHRDRAEQLDAAPDRRLRLITCYPFDAIDPGTDWRYVVDARLINATPL